MADRFQLVTGKLPEDKDPKADPKADKLPGGSSPKERVGGKGSQVSRVHAPEGLTASWYLRMGGGDEIEFHPNNFTTNFFHDGERPIVNVNIDFQLSPIEAQTLMGGRPRPRDQRRPQPTRPSLGF